MSSSLKTLLVNSMKKRSTSKTYSTDGVMKNLWLCLARDFRASMSHNSDHYPLTQVKDGDIKGFRSTQWPDRLSSSPWIFKTDYQLETLFKRYRFRDDMFSDAELAEKTNENFVKTQIRICEPLKLSPAVMQVLREARLISKDILGQYDPEEHMKACRFGKRACVGSSYARSYLDLKLSSNSITGSHDHIGWMEEYLSTDKLLREILQGSDDSSYPPYKPIDTLALTNVPKSFKSLRGIMPNTLIGSFYTYGLGQVITSRLKEKAHLNISNLQEKHRVMCRKYSMDRSHVTADLSAASDSPTYELLMRVIPYQWMKVLKYGRINHCTMDGRRIYLRSFMTMGIGFTFPLETLLFYVLLKAIKNLSGVRGRISVYGDDLIYPKKMHAFVRHVFPCLNVQLNEDKTFVESHFRETCGADFYRGVDVRPFQPEGEASELKPLPFQQFLYKLINGLLRRWEKEEIPSTYNFLLTTLAVVSGNVLCVPPSFPDESGIRMDLYSFQQLRKERWEIPFSPIFYCTDKSKTTYQSYVFKFLRRESDDRSVTCLAPFYWESLRLADSGCQEVDPFTNIQDAHVLKWKELAVQPRNYRSKITGRRLRKKWAYVASKTKASVVRKNGVSSDWT